jgi:SecD/SecF fusion protein
MRNKSTVIALLVIFIAICGYNLYWTYVQFKMEGDYNQWLSTKRQLELKDSLNAEEQDLLNQAQDYFSDTENMTRYQNAVKNSFTLGLDLQGGMFVTLEVSVQDLLRQLAGSSRENADFKAAIQRANELAQASEVSYVDLFVQAMEEVNPEANFGAMFNNRAKDISPSTPKDQVVSILKKEAEDAINRTFEIIRKRVDQFGVVSPNLQKQDVTGRILLELPGVKEPERVRKLLRSTARLEFWETHTIADMQGTLVEINEKMKQIEGIETEADSTEADAMGEMAEGDSLAVADADTAADDSLQGLEDLMAADSATPEDDLPDDEAIAEFRKENPFFRYLQLPSGQINGNLPVMGYATDADTAKINSILSRKEIRPIIPDDVKFAWTFKPTDGTENLFTLLALRPNPRNDSASLDGGVVTDARQDFDRFNQAVVSMEMNQRGSKEWARITAANVQKSVAITLDGKVYSFPTVQEEISGGTSQISGSFDIDEAKDLATVLKAGQLPVGARIESEDVVGPTLGEANVNSGFTSFLAAFVLTLIFMAFYYARAGLIANVALLANLVFILGCSAAFTIVLTLPGIAAVVLTVGMAVDANVLIFERIREEQARGKTMKASIKSGFSNAFSSVMDANITTFLTGVVLYAFGVGPIRGFAVSLMIGIVTSLISALIITRLILDSRANKGKDSISFGFSFTTGLFDKIKLDMVHKRKTFYTISGALLAVFIISFFTLSFKTGVDFNGGRQFVVVFAEDASNDDFSAPINLSNQQIETFRTDLTDAYEGQAPIVKTLSADNKLQVTTSFRADDIGTEEGSEVATDDVINRLNEALGKTMDPAKFTIESSFMVGPTLANDIKRAALYAVVFSLLIIFFYILVRFRKWQYSAGAVVAIFHDVIIVLGIFSVLSVFDLPFSVEIDQAFIAALLTIIGYSINDTVVVFDRIRENIGEMKSSKLDDIYNISIDQTISRTLITSVTTLLTAIILFTFGGDVIRGFIFAIIIGIIVGTYSSIFVASPISLDLIQRGEAKKAKDIL